MTHSAMNHSPRQDCFGTLQGHVLRLAPDAAQGNAAAPGLHKYWMKLETEPIRESGQVVEDPYYLRNLEALHLVKAEDAQHLPVRYR